MESQQINYVIAPQQFAISKIFFLQLSYNSYYLCPCVFLFSVENVRKVFQKIFSMYSYSHLFPSSHAFSRNMYSRAATVQFRFALIHRERISRYFN